jgi:hypothetical protein
MRTKAFTALTLAVLAFGSLSSLWTDVQAQDRYRRGGWYGRTMMPAGTALQVRLDTKISTDDNHQGDSWSGTVTQSVVSGDRVVIPAGTPVSGVVTMIQQGTHETRPQIALAVRRVNVDGRMRVVNADTEPIVAGSNRAKKIGAIAGGAAVGALVGHSVAKKSHGTLIGGLLGGAAGYGLTRHALRTMQLKEGTVVTFTTNEDVAMR